MEWTTSEVRRLKSVLRATSAPLSFGDLDTFTRELFEPLLALVEAHGGQLYITDLKLRLKPVFLHHTYDPKFTEDYRKRFFDESPLHNVLRRGGCARGAFDVGSVVDYPRLEKTCFYNEFLKPRGIHYMAGFASRIPGSRTMVMLGAQRRRRQAPFDESDIEVFDLLMAPTQGAIRTLLLAEGDRERLEQSFRQMPVGVLVLDWKMNPVYRNPALEEMLAGCPLGASELDRLRLEANAARRAYQARVKDDPVTGRPPVRLHRGEQQLTVRISILSEGLLGTRRHILCLFESHGVARPELVRQRLKESHGLTEREAEVAVHCVDGKTNPEIASALGISRETVKYHLKQIFDKTGIDRRSQLASVMRGPACPP